MKKFILKLADKTDDQYHVYTDNRATMLCDEQVFDEFIRLDDVIVALNKCEGDLDYFRSMLPVPRTEPEPAKETPE